MSSRYRLNNRGGGQRQGAKDRTKNRFAHFDADILSNYDDVEEDPQPISSRMRRGPEPVMARRGGIVMNARLRDDRSKLLGAAGRNTELVNKVKVHFGRRYGERWIIKQLNKQDIDNFAPILISTTAKGDIEFFLKSDDAAEAIKAISKRIIHQKSGDRIMFTIQRVPATWTKLSKPDLDLINQVVDSRYNQDNRAMDLSEFFLDPAFVAKDAHMLLSKNNVMLAVLDRIDEKFGNITALSLKGNRLRHMDCTAMLVYCAKFLSVLDLSDNLIDSLEQMQKLRGLPVKVLFFEGNPICEQLTKSSDYLNAVHQVFPKVIKLDGQDVPASSNQLADDDEDEPTNEIPPRPGFYANDEKIQQLVETFIIHYMEFYDGTQGAATRKQLIPAYDADTSSFTLTIENLGDSDHVKYKNSENFTNLLRSSHNILKEDKWERYRSTRLFNGAMEIAVQLAKMPVTNHFKESFIVDVHFVSPALIGFTLQGLFEEGPFAAGGEVPTLNYFCRSFYVAPRNDGDSLAIISDMLYISAISVDRMARYKMLINKCLSNGHAPAAVASSSMSDSAPQPALQPIQMQMVEQFSEQSGMLPEWSQRCLQDSNWDYDEAGKTFISMRDQIPREAFAVPPQ